MATHTCINKSIQNLYFQSRKMDTRILRAIVQSRSEVMKEVDDPEAFERSLIEDKFPVTDPAILAALSKSFANLISYKVSPDAYQRYSVRIQVIEVLRNWLRPPRALESHRTFCQGERVLDLTARILRAYLKNEIFFRDDGNIDAVVNLARALMCLLPKNKIFVRDLEKLLHKIAGLGQTEDSRRLVLSAVEENGRLGLGFPTVERLYVCQSAKLVEQPLLENFAENLRDSKDTASPRDSKSSCSVDELLKVAVQSPTVFQIACSVLKEILVHLDYSPKVLNYINFFLSSLGSRCQEHNKNPLDLYPLRLQSCVLLLNIEPEQHTSNSRDYVLRFIEKINESNPEETLILLSHFPSWLQALGTHLEDSCIVTNMSTDDVL